jgi:cyclic pyranopterin phosphate synthase
MIDPFGRSIRYVRISVTDRCNLRCRYCMPLGYLGGEQPAEILSYEEIATIAEALVGLGVRKFRLTGGEPLVRRELEVLVAKLAAFPEVEDRPTRSSCATRRWPSRRRASSG